VAEKKAEIWLINSSNQGLGGCQTIRCRIYISWTS